jgi:hypothetical protein
MTPERKQWWDSLPRREKMLREQIEKTKIGISYLKFALQIGCFTDNDKKWVISRIKKKKVTLTALKHELDNKAVATYMGYYQEAFPMYRCKKCGGTFENFGQSYCCWCGRKIVEVNNK